MYLRGYLNS